MAYNYVRAQSVAARMITKYGWPAKLRRDSHTDRDCIAVEIDQTPVAATGKNVNPVARVFLIASKDLSQPPVDGKDALVTLNQDLTDNEVLRIVSPPGRLAPAGIVVYWELHVTG